ncbi:coat protein [ssRNA phage SRR6960799_17]|uniref:Coat protein n=1 Tax=ssRNA phage SRR6960799_17 TaxID=2786573 RepID=A0A8S5L3C2_9VIRU|nr:coat protein [ssRNA phage SRR6960799_17]DAD52278.1 TPA_asm: coat protein [ssRNA phage SRR6960799_17]
MSNIANIVVFDGAATPVTHTLVPVEVVKDPKTGAITAMWREQVASLPTYAQVVAIARLSKTNKSGVWNTDFRVEVPVMESVSGQNSAGYTAAPKVAYRDTTGIYGHYHERGSIAGRRLSRQIALNIGNNVSTSVAAATSGVLPELFDTLVAPT